MSFGAADNPFRSFKKLWSRAPAWRLCGLFAGLLSLVFALSLRTGKQDQAANGSGAALAQATYVVPPPSDFPPSQNGSVISNSANVLPSSNISTGPSTKSQPAVAPTKDALSASDPSSKQVQIAKLSLATPTNASGLSDKTGFGLKGPSYSNSIKVDRYTVQLPPGTWVSLAHTRATASIANGELVFLGQVKNARLVGAVEVYAWHRLPNGEGHFPVKLNACSSYTPHTVYRFPNAQRNLYVYTDVMDGAKQGCWIVNSYFTPNLRRWADPSVKLPRLERQAAGAMEAAGISYPQNFVRIEMDQTEDWGMLQCVYFFSPENDHIRSNDVSAISDTDWNIDNIGRYPEKVAYVEKLKDWAATFWPRLKGAFKDAAP